MKSLQRPGGSGFQKEGDSQPVLLPVIHQQAVTPEGCRYLLEIPRNLVYFTGHFDEFALLPGVVQVKWVVEFAAKDLGITCSGSVEKLKFTRPIRPGEVLELILRRTQSGRLAFSWRNEEHRFSEGEFLVLPGGPAHG